MITLIMITILSLFSPGLSKEYKNGFQQCENDFRSVIQKQIFKLSKIKIIVNGKIIRISNIVLYDIDVKSIKISKKQEKSANNDSLSLNLEINEAYLNATIKTFIKTHIRISSFNLSLPIEFTRAKNQLIENLTINKDSFNSYLDNLSITFEGFFSSLVQKYVPLIYDSIKDLVNNNTNFYSFLNPMIKKKGKKFLDMINGCIRSKVNTSFFISLCSIGNYGDFIVILFTIELIILIIWHLVYFHYPLSYSQNIL